MGQCQNDIAPFSVCSTRLAHISEYFMKNLCKFDVNAHIGQLVTAFLLFVFSYIKHTSNGKKFFYLFIHFFHIDHS